MSCPICDQKAANCDCTATERAQHEALRDALAEIARLRDERDQIMRRRWVVRCGYYDDSTSIMDAIRRVSPPLVIEWTGDDGDVDLVEQMQPLPPPPGEGEVEG